MYDKSSSPLFFSSDGIYQKNHAAIYTAVICIGVCMINIFGVRWFGESEFCFSIIKSEYLAS